MPFPPTDPNHRRIIPTERLIDLCAEARTNADAATICIDQTLRLLRGLLPEALHLQIAATLTAGRPNTSKLSATEAYLKYNKAKLLRNRSKAAAASPTYIPPAAYAELAETGAGAPQPGARAPLTEETQIALAQAEFERNVLFPQITPQERRVYEANKESLQFLALEEILAALRAKPETPPDLGPLRLRRNPTDDTQAGSRGT